MTFEPRLGEIRRSWEIGKKGRHKWMWCACEMCGKERWALFNGKINKSVTKICLACNRKKFKEECHGFGFKATRWKGGRRKDVHGYILIHLQLNDFFYPMADVCGEVPEHRLVIAKALNRCLLPWEIIHHKNGTRDDNRLENLQLLGDQKYHVIDSIVKRRIKHLESRVTLLEAENVVLKTQLLGQQQGITQGGQNAT